MFATAISEKDKRLIQEGEVKGRIETLAEAEAKIKREKENMAKQMKKDGMPLANICKYTGLTSDEVEKL